jgi:hypothetical protein
VAKCLHRFVLIKQVGQWTQRERGDGIGRVGLFALFSRRFLWGGCLADKGRVFVDEEHGQVLCGLAVADLMNVADEPYLVATASEGMTVGSPTFGDDKSAIVVGVAGGTFPAPLHNGTVGGSFELEAEEVDRVFEGNAGFEGLKVNSITGRHVVAPVGL